MNTFKKEERLCSEKAIGKIFKSGNVINKYPYKAIWIYSEDELEFPIQVAISVPKRNFKKAVDRNLIKRRIREAYRTNKASVYSTLSASKKNIQVVIIYISKEILPFTNIEKKLVEFLEDFEAKIN